jgi:DNA modification methylase
MAAELKDKTADAVGHMGDGDADSSATSPSVLHEPGRRIELVPVSRLKPYGRNARTHSKKQIRQIADSIERFGFNNPVLIDDGDQIIAGHGRVEAAKLVGLAEVPTLRLSHMCETDVRAYIIADNRLAEKAGWDREILAIELQTLIDCDFQVEVTGFDVGEIDLTPADADDESREAAGPEDAIPELAEGKPVSRAGDLWVLGKHRLLCADARDDAAYDRLLVTERANVVFAEPPYNVAISGHASRGTQRRHREFPMATGEMSSSDFTEFLSRVFQQLVDHSESGSVHFQCMDWRHVGEMLEAGRESYDELLNVCVWAKTHFGMGQYYRSQHEFVFVWKCGQEPQLNNLPYGPQGRSRSNLWSYPNIARAGQSAEYGFHPTVKPVAMVADAIKDCSRRNGIVLDPFSGVGTTLIAAERTGRRARGIEIDPLYVDTAVRRWQKYTGKAATLAATGQSFEEVEVERTAIPQVLSDESDAASRAEAA